MLNKPKFMTPSTNLQECVIDLKADNIPFSCIIDGNEAISDWQLKVYRIDNNVLIFDTGKQTLKSPFFPVDEKNRNKIFSVNLKDYLSSEYPNFVNSSIPYYWKIQFWGTSGTTVTSCEEVFYANTTLSPVLSYSTNGTNYVPLTDGTVFSNKDCWFKSSYEQPEGVSLKRYGWRIINKDTREILLDTITKNQIYGVGSNIVCFYNGFLNDGNYSVEVYIETQNGSTIVTPPINTVVSYETTFLTNDFKTDVLRNESGIILDWGDSVVIGGRAQGFKDEVPYLKNYPISGNTSVKIEDGASIIFDQGSSSDLDISEDAYIVLSTQMSNGEDRVIFSIEGCREDGSNIARKLMYANGKFVYYVINDDVIIERNYTPVYKPCEYVWYIITMSPFLGENGTETTLTIVESHTVGALYPSNTLYPSASTYPSRGVWNKLKEE